jgi:hypothetical protein
MASSEERVRRILSRVPAGNVPRAAEQRVRKRVMEIMARRAAASGRQSPLDRALEARQRLSDE